MGRPVCVVRVDSTRPGWHLSDLVPPASCTVNARLEPHIHIPCVCPNVQAQHHQAVLWFLAHTDGTVHEGFSLCGTTRDKQRVKRTRVKCSTRQSVITR
jgi:hypothetical protein